MDDLEIALLEWSCCHWHCVFEPKPPTNPAPLAVKWLVHGVATYPENMKTNGIMIPRGWICTYIYIHIHCYICISIVYIYTYMYTTRIIMVLNVFTCKCTFYMNTRIKIMMMFNQLPPTWPWPMQKTPRSGVHQFKSGKRFPPAKVGIQSTKLNKYDIQWTDF